MEQFPIHAFLESLSSDEIRPTVRDYDRLLRAFQVGGTWTVPRLRNTLTALLARDEDQQRLIRRRFDRFFLPETELERRLPEIDVGRVWKELREVPPDPAPLPPPVPKPEESLVSQDQAAEEEPDAPIDGKKSFRWWGSALLLLVLAVVGGILLLRPGGEGPQPGEPSVPICRLLPNRLDLGSVEPGNSRNATVAVANEGKAALIIEGLGLASEDEGVFEATFPDPPVTLQPGEETELAVTFKPSAEASYSATIRVDHNAEAGVDTVALSGRGTTARREYRRVAHVEAVRIETLDRSEAWKRRAVLTGVLLSILLAWGLHMYRLHRGPFVKRPKVDRRGARFFHPGLIGGRPEPRLDEATLAQLADSMGYFKSGQAGNRLDVPASIRETIRQGGIPSCTFFARTRLRSLLILEDADAEALRWNPLSRELAEGIGRYGVPVLYGRFRGTPERFRTEDGHIHYLEDLEDRRQGILMLLFTDGKGFHRPRNAFALESVARWPMKAWMELRERRFWDDTLRLAVQNAIPVYPATRDGVVRAVQRYLTEQGSTDRISGDLLEGTWLPERGAGRDVGPWLEHFLGDALPWAQDCTLMQPMTDGLADALRRAFHGDLPPEAIERLYELPNTTRTEAGFRFADDIQAGLRRGLLHRRSEEEREKVFRFVLDRIEEARPKGKRTDLAYLTWDAVRVRVGMEWGKEKDLKRFGELLRTPLAKFLGDSLDRYGLTEQEGKIPLLRSRLSQGARQWLRNAPGNPLGIRSFLSWRHWVLCGIFAALFLASLGWTLTDLFQPVRNFVMEVSEPNLEATPAVLETWQDGGWRVAREGAVGALGPDPLTVGRRYRLKLQAAGYQEEETFRVDEGQKAVLVLVGKDLEVDVAGSGYPVGVNAGDEWTEPNTGMTFVYVPGGEFEMGCGGEWAGDCYSNEKPAHPVRVSGFWMGKYEVTVGEFRQFASETKHSTTGCNDKQGDRHPVACVSWEDASAFAGWLAKKNEGKIGFRLPTEAEWEYACRNRGQNVLYCGGDDIEKVAWYDGNSGGATHTVGGKKDNGFGIHDMSGNVWEWCRDWYGGYAKGLETDPTGPQSGTNRVLRGGSWGNGARNCRSSIRVRFSPAHRSANFGFRLVFPAGQ